MSDIIGYVIIEKDTNAFLKDAGQRYAFYVEDFLCNYVVIIKDRFRAEKLAKAAPILVGEAEADFEVKGLARSNNEDADIWVIVDKQGRLIDDDDQPLSDIQDANLWPKDNKDSFPLNLSWAALELVDPK